MLRMWIVLALPAIALAQVSKSPAPPAKAPAPAASPAELARCLKAVEETHRCAKDFCDLQASSIGTQTGRRMTADQIGRLKQGVATTCVERETQQNASEASRRAACEQMSRAGNLERMLTAYDGCHAKRSCADKAVCFQASYAKPRTPAPPKPH
jgi:hypothetical protein